MRIIHVTRQFFEASGRQSHLKKHAFRKGPLEHVYQISFLYRFPFGQEVWHKYKNKQIHKYIGQFNDTGLNISWSV